MSVSKDAERGTWIVYARYVDWQGKVKVLHKRGFKTKKEAVLYERELLFWTGIREGVNGKYFPAKNGN